MAGAVLRFRREHVLTEPGRQLSGLTSQARLLHDQLADEIHQVVELADLDPDRVRSRPPAGRDLRVRRVVRLDRHREGRLVKLLDLGPDGLVDRQEPPDQILELGRVAAQQRRQDRAAGTGLDLVERRNAGQHAPGLDRCHEPLHQPDIRPIGALFDSECQDGSRSVRRPRSGRQSSQQLGIDGAGRHDVDAARRGHRRRIGGQGDGQPVDDPAGERGGVVGEGAPGADLVDQDAQHIHRRQQQVVERRQVMEEPASEGPEDLFERVGELRHPGVADRRGGAFERVRRPEDLGERRFVRGVGLEFEEAPLDPFDLLDGLGDIDDIVARLEIEREVHPA